MLQHQSFTSTTMLDESSMTQSTSPSATPSSDVRLFRGRAAGLEDLHRYGPPHGAYAGPNTTTTTTSTSNSGGSLPEPREVPHHYYPGERLVPPTHDAAGTHWASPTEVMQLRSLCGDVVSKYRAELTKVESQLQAVQQERDALQLDLKKVEGLRGAYVDGAKAYASRKRQEGQWREEREMLRVQMQRLNVENQRLQLYIQQHGTRGRGHAMQDVVGGTTRSLMSVPSVLLSSGDAHPLPSPTHDATAASVGGEGGPNVDLPRRGTDTMDDTSMSLPHQERTLPLRPTATTHRGSSMLSEPRERSGAILGRHSGSGPLAGEPSPEGSSSSLRTPSTDVWSQSDNSRPRLGGAIPDASPRGTAIHTTSAEVGSSLATPSTSEPIQTAPSEEPPQAQRGERATAHVPPHYTDPGTASTLRTATTSYTESSSIPYLYHMPRTPAEAVEAEVKLFEALTRLTRQNEELAGQLKCVDTLHQLSTEQHDQRLLVLSRENEYLKREVRRLQDERDGYESQCHNLEQQHMEIEGQLHLLQQRVEEREMQVAQQAAKRHDEYEKERSSLKTQYEEEKLRIRSEADAAVAGAEAARRDAEVAFQRVVSERTPKQQELLLQVAELEKELAETRRESRESLQGVHGALREKSAACDQWEEKAHILEDSLRKAMAMRAEAQATATTLEEELGRARELRTTGEACIRSMDQRLEVSLAEVAGARQKLEDMEMMELHHQDALREVETLRMQLEREQRMWEAALTTCQVDHKRAMDVNVQRYEKLRLRYEAMKLRLEASRALPGGDGVEPRISAKTPATTDAKLVDSDEDVEGHTEPPPPSARLECDSLSILRSSTITAARLNSSIHHAPQSCFPHLPLSSP